MSPVPTQISRYEIKGLIAQGGMGDLYLARDPQTSRLVVLKLLNATVDSTDLRDRFEREAQSLASLNHPNIVAIYDYGEFQGGPFIVMEYVRGETLDEVINRRAPMSPTHKIELMTQLCAGLGQAHQAGIVHRDVKPANLMVNADGQLKILDFGIARVEGSTLTRMDSLKTHTNLQIGTPGYMPPEQMQAGEIDQRADLFAVGAVCYELLSYREAFSGGNSREIETKVMEAEPPPLSSLVPDLDPAIDPIVARALAKDRGQRYQDAATLGEALETYRRRLPPESALDGATLAVPTATPNAPTTEADAAYRNSLAALRDGARGAARRFAIEALADDPKHRDARALLERLEVGRPPSVPPESSQRSAAPPPVPAASRSAAAPPPSADETILIIPPPRPERVAPATDTVLVKPPAPPKRPDRPVAPAPAFPAETLVVPAARRPVAPVPAPDRSVVNPPRRPAPADETILVTPPRRPVSPLPAAETILIAAPRRAGASSSGDDAAFFIPSQLPLGPSPAPDAARSSRIPAKAAGIPKRSSRGWGFPGLSSLSGFFKRPRPISAKERPIAKTRGEALWRYSGALIVLAVFAVAAVVVFAGIRLSSWLRSSGQLLTITKPVGGTVTGPGVECGTGGSNCSTTRTNGEVVELNAVADAGFAFSGFLGDCAPTGRMLMSAARTCGAKFDPVSVQPQAAGWLLTITKPMGGTILAAGGITCGTLGSDCSATIPAGVPVTLHAQADAGYTLLHFTDECAPSGQTMMTGARTCGATFGPLGGGIPLSSEAVSEGPRPPPRTRQTATSVSPPQTLVPSAPPPTPQAGTAPAPPVESAPVVVVGTPAPPPITPEAHAKAEIQGVIKDYCSALETLSPAKVQAVYPTVVVRDLREQFRQYKSLKCMLTSPPEFTQLDADAGSAKIDVGMKQTIEMISGGAPKTVETIATTTLTRPELRSGWRIAGVIHKAKPPP